MADTTTTNLALTLPEVGASDGSWGGKVNTNFTLLDTFSATVLTAFAANDTYFVGHAGNSTTTGLRCFGAGDEALYSLTDGDDNTGIGYRAGYSMTTALSNTIVGSSAFPSGNGGYNCVFGAGAAATSTTGVNLCLFGWQAGYSGTSAGNSVGVGHRALYSDVTGGYSIAIGPSALFAATAGSNIAIGESAGIGITTATNTTIVGRRGAYTKTTGGDCSYFGHNAGYSGDVTKVASGEGVTGIGAYSFGHSTTAAYNTGCGRASGWYVDTGSRNAYLGYRAGYGNVTANDTLALGYYAGHNTPDSDGTILIGSGADFYIPSSSMTATAAAGGSVAVGTYAYRVVFVLDSVQTALSEPSSVTLSGSDRQVDLAVIPTYTGPKTCSARKIYRTTVGGENKYFLVTTISDNTTTTYTDTTVDGSLGAQSDQPDGAIVLGTNARAYKAGQMVVGSTDYRITELVIGGGDSDTSPAAVTIQSSNASGTNTAGAALKLAGGKGTGTGRGGTVSLSTAAAGSSGTAANSLTDFFTLDARGFYTIKEAAAVDVPTPSAGTVNMFFESGALKFRKSDGTLMTVTAT